MYACAGKVGCSKKIYIVITSVGGGGAWGWQTAELFCPHPPLGEWSVPIGRGSVVGKQMATPQTPVSAQMAAPTPISVLCSGYRDLHMEVGEYRPRSQVFTVLPPQAALQRFLFWPVQMRGPWQAGSEHPGEVRLEVPLAP